MAKHRSLPTVIVFALVATFLPLVAALPAGAQSSPSGDPGLLGTEVRGTGVLPNFAEEGANLIRLQVGAFDPLADPVPAPPGIPVVPEATLAPGTAQYWLVQVRDNQFPAVADAVTAAGGLIVGYVHDDTYMVRATPAQSALIEASPSVRWAGYYQPAWRVPVGAAGRPSLLDLDGTRVYRVHVFAEDPSPASVGEALAKMPGVEVVGDAGVVVDVRATAAQVPAMAALPSVEWIGVRPKAVALNANSRWVNDTGIRDLFSATAPGRLTGAGQTAAVADTGLNYTYDLNHRAHVAFRDCDASGVCKEAIYTQLQPGAGEAQMNDVVNNATGHRKMVAFFDLGATGPNPFDESSHGSHTAGSVDGDQPPFGQYTADDGLAPAAMHVHQNIGSSSGGLVLPEDLYDLFRQAYRPRNPAGVSETSGPDGNPSDYSTNYRPLEDARTHNNSWGLIVPLADLGDSVRLDQFVWDHEDMVVSVSAGNAGPAPGSIGAPSVAKSDLSSGASANGRQPMVSIDSMASFSSHGPTADGRLGPDLATPGQVVVSVKGGSTRGYHVAQGTSMSSPVLTGLATLVRQYFFDGYAAAGGDGFAAGAPGSSRSHNPSAALVKAALINGAVRMRGFYTGDDGTTRALDGQWPSAGQGFGRVNLTNSLYFAGDPTNNWYIDRFRGDTSGPMNNRSFSVSALPQTRTFQLKVGAGQPLDVTLAWTDAPDLLPAGSPALINNLDLVVTAPNGTTYVGNNMNSRTNPAVNQAETLPGAGPADVDNPTERVRIAAPAAGTYTVTVQAGPIADGNQGFALAASGNIAPVGGTFTPGPQLQVDQAGNPTISGVTVKALSANTAEVRFETNEPTTATADVSPSVGAETFVDSYNEGTDGFTGLNEGQVETSAEFADKPVVGTKHEMLLTGFAPEQTYSIQLTATDLASNATTHSATLKSPATVFQADSPDTGQCYEGDPSCQWDDAATATQLYAGNVDGGALGAFMFRTQGVDPNAITMATVEMTSSHNWVVPYTQDPVLYVDLLDEGVEPNWGTQDYGTIHNAAADARVFPETTHKVGAYQRYAFTFNCADLQALKDTFASNGNAAFRWDSNDGGFFSMEFGFNRRSGGPDLRPRLVLYTGATETNPTGEDCNPNTPAPTITDVGIHGGIQDGSVTVSWDTDVASDSLVLFREQGTEPWIQVGTPARTRVHHVQVFGLTPEKEYEFAVRSAACNGATTTDTNQGKGYDFFRAPPPEVPTDEYFFHGEATDQAEKAAFDPHAATFDLNPADATPGTQIATPFANENFVANPLAAYWTGDFSGPIDGEVELQWYWSTENATAIAIGADVEVTFFADPDFSPEADPVQPEKVIGRGVTTLTFDGTLPTLNTSRIPVNGTVQGEMTVQVVPIFVDTGEGLVAHYDSVTPSKMLIPTEPAPEPAEPLPLTGPVPPPSAGATGLNPPPTRTGSASAADIAAGTGYCDIPAQKADLSISKSDSPDPIFAGRELTYTLTVSNGGPADATGVTVTDTLPPGVTFNSASASQGSCSQAGGTVTCNLGGLGSGAPPATVTIKVTPQTAGTITNTASVSGNEEDPAPGNNTDTETTTVSAAADLAVTKTDAPDPAQVGQDLVYTIVVTNNGPQAASGVTATDSLPKNAGFGSVTTTKGTCSLKPSKRQVVCSIGPMAGGESVTIVIRVKPTQKGTITNTVTVSATSPPDPNTANNTATATTVVRPSSLI
jgi:uncharacterized repeat protein (TIGR01451 family)